MTSGHSEPTGEAADRLREETGAEGPVTGAQDTSQEAAAQAAAPGTADTAGEQGAGEQGDGEDNGLAADLGEAQQAVAALTADLQRLQAEYVNYKRRVDRDRELVQQNATFKVLSALLPVLDSLDRAREHGELEGGFKAIADSLENIVAAQGLVKFGRPGDEFDPRYHEALMHSHSSEVSTTTCQEVVTAGYQIGDRVVRPAKVTVVDPAPGEDGPGEGRGGPQPEPH